VTVTEWLTDFVNTHNAALTNLRTGGPIYDYSEWCQHVEDAVIALELFMPITAKLKFQFIIRPARKDTFWALVHQQRLPAFEFLGPAALGLLMEPGFALPRAVIYDRKAAEECYGSSYRDPETVPEERRLRRVREQFEKHILRARLGSHTPIVAVPYHV